MTRAGRRIFAPAWLAAALVLLGLCTAPAARADGDPASDELMAQNVFYPYSSPVPDWERRRLNTAVAAARGTGIPLKVALIARRTDLGSITALYSAPQRYAAFLETEISYGHKVPLLVVMHDGFGTAGLTAWARRVVLGAPPPAAWTGSALASAAAAAVGRLDARTGATSASEATAKQRSGPGGRTILLLALVTGALFIGGLLVIVRVFFPPTA